MSLINEVLKKSLTTESAVDDSKIGGGPNDAEQQQAPEISGTFESEAHGTKHDTPGTTTEPGAETAAPELAQTDATTTTDTEAVTAATGEETPATEQQEPAQAEPNAVGDDTVSTETQPQGESDGAAATDDQSSGADTSAETAPATEETPAADDQAGAEATETVTTSADGTESTSAEETQDEPSATETNTGTADDGLGSTDPNAGSDTESDDQVSTDTESDAGAGAETDSADSETNSEEPQPDTENPDNVDPIEELPDPQEESELKPEVKEAEDDGEEIEIDSDTDTDEELAEKADLVAGYSDAKQSLEEIVETISESLTDGGLTPEGMAAAQGATNDVLSSVGEPEMGMPSVESLQSLMGRRENTKLVMESITEKAVQLGRKIWQTLCDIITRLLSKFTGVESMIKDFDSMEQQLNDIIATRKVVHPAAHMELSSEYCRGLGIRKDHDRIVAGEWAKIADWLPKASASLEKQLAGVVNKLGDMSAEVPEIVDVGTTPPPAALTLGTDVADKAVVVFTPRLMLEVIKSYSKSTRELLPVLTNCRSMETIRKFAEHQITKTEAPSDEEKAKVRSLVAYIPKAAKFQVFVRNNIAVTRLFCNHYVRLAQRLV